MQKPAQDHVLTTASRPPVVMAHGKGSRLYDTSGREYLDFMQGWAVNALGHAPNHLARALSEQAERLWHSSPAFFNEPQLALSSALAQASGLDRVFLCATGAEANESAIKLARKWGALHRGGAYTILTTENSFHGRTLATMSASGKPAFAPLFEPKVPGFRKVPYADIEAMRAALDDGVVAVMLEPIQGEAGVVVPPPGYLEGIRELCDARGSLFILDEVQTGMGRTGRLFAFEHENARPDVMTLGKGLGGGLPLAAMLCAERCNCFSPGDQGGTHSGNALSCAVGKAVLDIVSTEDFLGHVEAAGRHLAKGLERLPGIEEVRGKGLLVAARLAAPHASDVVAKSLERGLLLNAPRPDLLRFMPALDVPLVEIDEMLARLEPCLRSVGQSADR